MQELTGAEAMLRVLEDEGIEYIFGNPGTTEIPLLDPLAAHPKLKYVLALQEGAAMAMADNYSRATGKLCVANFHNAPGLGNAIGAMFTARHFGSPVIVTAGQWDNAMQVREPIQTGDLVAFAQPVVKWATEARRPEDVPLILRRAAKIALTPPTGPVFVSLPGNAMNGTARMDLGAVTRPSAAAAPEAAEVQRLAERLLAAERPVLIPCREVFREDAFAEAVEVAELLGAAVMGHSSASTFTFPPQHPLYVRGLARNAEQIQQWLGAHDLIFMVGEGVVENIRGEGGALPLDVPVLQVTRNDWELGKNFPVEQGLVASVKATLRALAAELKARRTPAQAQRAAQRTAEVATDNWSTRRAAMFAQLKGEGREKMDAGAITNDWLMMTIAEALPKDAVVIGEAPTTIAKAHDMLDPQDRLTYFGPASGAIGWGMPGAVGTKLALPHRPVVALIGDGSTMYCPQALWTAEHLKLPVVFVIPNNRAYAIVKNRLVQMNGHSIRHERLIGMDIRNPDLDFVALAASQGVPAEKVSKPADVVPALQRALARKDGPTLVEIETQDPAAWQPRK